MIQRFLVFLAAAMLALIASSDVRAQADTVESPMSVLHGVYAHLDPLKMPHGVLFQTAFPLATLPHFTGKQQRADSLRVDIIEFGRILFTLGSAVRDTLQPALFTTGYRNHYQAKSDDGHVQHTGVLAAGGILLEHAFDNG